MIIQEQVQKADEQQQIIERLSETVDRLRVGFRIGCVNEDGENCTRELSSEMSALFPSEVCQPISFSGRLSNAHNK